MWQVEAIACVGTYPPSCAQAGRSVGGIAGSHDSESGEPIFITKNGEGDLVLMSLAAYERLHARLDLYRLLDEAEADVRAGDRGVSPATLRRRLKR